MGVGGDRAEAVAKKINNICIYTYKYKYMYV